MRTGLLTWTKMETGLKASALERKLLQDPPVPKTLPSFKEGGSAKKACATRRLNSGQETKCSKRACDLGEISLTLLKPPKTKRDSNGSLNLRKEGQTLPAT